MTTWLFVAHVRHDAVLGLAGTAWRSWTWEPITVLLLIVSAFVYQRGVRALWRRAGRDRGIRVWEAAAFALGLVSLAVALLSPLAWLSSVLFSAHMTQHEVLMLVSAPLLVFGRPLFAGLWAFTPDERGTVGRWLQATPLIRTWHALSAPLAVFLLHAAALWIWHVPAFYEAALVNEGLHAVQHLTLLVTAALFWWGMVHGRYGRTGYGVAVLYVFLTALHSSVLGALLTMAPGVWYRTYSSTGVAWQIDALQDQQLAGLLMWVPSGVLFIVFGLALLAAWLGESERRARLLFLFALLAIIPACGRSSQAEHAELLTGANVQRGIAAIGRYGCGSCHEIPGVRSATGTGGPPLTRVARRTYLAGRLANSPPAWCAGSSIRRRSNAARPCRT
jgi:putative membrane protein